eukprot:SM000104S09338  [mRNA]  locus=s104:172470:177265:- [translate_table: standard]
MVSLDCDCMHFGDDVLARYQYVSDFFIAIAYFSIPLELIYFVKKSAVFPYRWVLVQFGAFIVLCGATHLINLWTFNGYDETVAIVMTVAKVLTAVVSCATALMLVHIIPDLLSVKTRELFLKNKAAELDREMGLIRTQEETGRHVRMLTHEIRSTLDRHTILNTTLVELGKTLSLEECSLWMPRSSAQELTLCHTLRSQNPMPVTVPIQHPTIKQVFSSNRAVVISPNSPVALARPRSSKYMTGDVVAVRVPLLHLNNFHTGDWPDSTTRSYALLVLMLPSDSARRWHVHELEMVEVVADQVAVALSHAAILEESLRARDLLMEQNVALDMARREAETAIRARNDFLAVMNHEMRTPMHAVIALSSLIQETELTSEQRSMVETVLRSSNLLATLINDVLDLSRLEDGSLELDRQAFKLQELFDEVINLVKPIASVKRLTVTVKINSDVPKYVVGDSKRLLQTALNVVGNAVKDTGLGISPNEMPLLFNKFVQTDAGGSRTFGGSGLGLAICKRFVSLMQGHIWLEIAGVGKGATVTFIVKLGLPSQEDLAVAFSEPPCPVKLAGTGLKTLVVDDNSLNRMVTRGLLCRLGCEVTTVNSGKECLAALVPGHTFSVIMLDLVMPEMDGFEVARRILERYPKLRDKESIAQTRRPLLVALTACTDRATKERCLALGMDSVVAKPVSLDSMRTVLASLH